MDWFEYGALFAIAAISTIAITPLAKAIAIKVDAVDYPSARRVNKRPVPRMGGIAIFGGTLVCLVALIFGVLLFELPNPFAGGQQLSQGSTPVNHPLALAGVAFMFLVGIVDDVRQLRARQKLFGQIIAASIVAASGLLLSSVRNPLADGFIEFGWISYPLTVFYLVAFANIINLIDGLDGLAAGISAISAITIFIFAINTQRYDAAFCSIVIAGACVGFLRYNFNPASIFMGDSGALFLGFSLGAVSLLAIARSAFIMSVMLPVLAAGIPVLDTAAAILRRLREHRSIGEPDRGHIHHRLLDAGFSQRKTVLTMWGWTLVLAASGIVITETSGVTRIACAAIVCGVTLYVTVKLRLLEPVLSHHYNPRTRRKSAIDQDNGHRDSSTSSEE